MDFLPPAPPVPRNPQQQQTAFSNASYWNDWYEQLRNIVNLIAKGISWTLLTDTPTTLAGYGITDTTSGTYTPTLTNVANLDGSTAYQCQYIRIKNVVTVSGKVDINPTLAAMTTQLGISLPINSTFGGTEDCAGTAFSSSIAGQGAAILADTSNGKAQLTYIAGDVTNQPMYFSFTYKII